MKTNQTLRYATALSLALAMSTAYAAGDTNSEPMTGKQKATAIGATTGAVAGAVVGGPVGAVIGAGIGGVVGHEGTDANGKVTDSSGKSAMAHSDGTVRSAQAALNDQGYSVGAVDGQWGPSTQNAVRKYQADKGLPPSGTLDSTTLSSLGINR